MNKENWQKAWINFIEFLKDTDANDVIFYSIISIAIFFLFLIAIAVFPWFLILCIPAMVLLYLRFVYKVPE